MISTKRRTITAALKILFVIFMYLWFCEYAIYPVVIFQCSWPNQHGLKAMFLADTHLLGPYKGHWFDKLRREWQMHRAFQTAIMLHKPEAVFFLGDLFDEGQWVNNQVFEEHVLRFQKLFWVDDTVKIYTVVGNHDVGFHYKMTPRLHSRFNKAFNTSSVSLVTLQNVHFVLVNSMAMERDGCSICAEALKSLSNINSTLSCMEDKNCNRQNMPEYSQPILLQHFPMYRESDAMCVGEDTAPEHEKYIKFRINMDCLSSESSVYLMKKLNPRLILSGHTHHYCHVQHKSPIDEAFIPEYSTPSFSWRNRNDPSFFLGTFSRESYELSKCYMPKETTVKGIYTVGILHVLWLVVSFKKILRMP